jgi:hypothetical protein
MRPNLALPANGYTTGLGEALSHMLPDNPVVALYVGGVVMSVTMLACLLIVHPELMRAAIDEAQTVAGLSRPAVITFMVAAYSIGWPISLPIVIALLRQRQR